MNRLISYKIIFLASVLLDACGPLWIPDPVDPRLPKYTEMGDNVAGAIVNGKIWKAEAQCFLGCNYAMKFLLNNDSSLSVLFDGKVDDRYMEFYFTIRSQSFLSMPDSLTLDGKKFMIDGAINTVVVSDSAYVSTTCSAGASGQGQLYFRSAKEFNDHLAYSGTFGFTLNDPSGCGTYEVFYGRFDFWIIDKIKH